MLAYEPPSVGYFSEILRLEVQDMHALKIKQSIIPVPSNDNEPIQLNKLHHTLLRDFLIDRSRSGDLFFDPALVHDILAAGCLRALLRNLKRGILSMDETAFYAVRYWPRHLKDSHSISSVLCKALQDFSSSRMIDSWIKILVQSELLVDTTNQLSDFEAEFTKARPWLIQTPQWWENDYQILQAITTINKHLKVWPSTVPS